MPSMYVGDDTNHPDGLTLPEDGDGPNIKAADVNTPFEGLADNLAFLKSWRRDAKGLLRTLLGATWPFANVGLVDPGVPSSQHGPTCRALYDKTLGRWIAGADIAAAHVTLQSFDAGLTWGAFGSWPGDQLWAIAQIPTGDHAGRIVAIEAPSVGNFSNWVDPGDYIPAATWQPTPFNMGGTGNAEIRDLEWFAGGSKLIAVGGDTGDTAVLMTSTDGATWSDISAQIPAAAANDEAWTLDVSPSLAVIFSKTAARAVYASSADGSTWTSRTSPVGAGESVIKVVYLGSAGWMLLTSPGAGSTRVYTSSSGVGSWTLVATISADLQAAAALEGVIVAAGKYGEVYESPDAGVTWARAQGGIYAGTKTPTAWLSKSSTRFAMTVLGDSVATSGFAASFAVGEIG